MGVMSSATGNGCLSVIGLTTAWQASTDRETASTTLNMRRTEALLQRSVRGRFGSPSPASVCRVAEEGDVGVTLRASVRVSVRVSLKPSGPGNRPP